MITNFCFGLICLLIPLLIELLNLQAALRLSNTGHSIVEVLILCGAYWLFVQILRLDEWLYLRYFFEQKSIPEQRSRPTFINALKNHRTVKP